MILIDLSTVVINFKNSVYVTATSIERDVNVRVFQQQ